MKYKDLCKHDKEQIRQLLILKEKLKKERER